MGIQEGTFHRVQLGYLGSKILAVAGKLLHSFLSQEQILLEALTVHAGIILKAN